MHKYNAFKSNSFLLKLFFLIFEEAQSKYSLNTNGKGSCNDHYRNDYYLKDYLLIYSFTK